jgi:hypothetical protein
VVIGAGHLLLKCRVLLSVDVADDKQRRRIGALPGMRAERLARLALLLSAAFWFAGLSWAGETAEAKPQPALPDAPQPQAPAQPAAPPPTPCQVKQASIGMALDAAKTAAEGAIDPAAAAAASGIGNPLASPAAPTGAKNDADLVPCSAEASLITSLPIIKKLPLINWYARFLDGPQVKPMTPKEKAWLAMRNVIDPFNGLTILGSSAIAVAANSHSAYGPGMTGWGKYVGVSYSQDTTGEFFGTFLIPSIVHQDPHYHRMPGASIKRRIAHVLYQVAWTQGDNGNGMLNYADLAGFAIDDEIGNLYVPGRETNARATAERYATALATTPIGNAVTEFLPDVARHIHVQVVVIQQIINQVAQSGRTAGPS